MHRPSRAAFAVGLVAALLACGDELVFLQTPWPADHVGVVIVTDVFGEAIAPAQVVAPGAATVQWVLPRASGVRLYARSWAPDVRAGDGRSLADCGLNMGAGTLAPSPSASWVTPVLALEQAPDGAFMPEPSPVRDFDLRLQDCSEPPLCEGFSARPVPLDGLRPFRIVHVGTHALAVNAPLAGGEPVRVLRVQGPTLTLLPPEPRIGRRRVRGLTFDPRPAPGRVLMVQDQGRVVVLDRDGAFQGEFTVPEVSEVNTGVDGETLFSSREGLFRLASGSTVAVPFEGGMPPFILPSQVDEVFVHRRSLRWVRVSNDVWSWTEQGWQQVFLSEPFDVLSQVSADRDFWGVAGEFELVSYRTPVSDRWEVLERPFDEGHRFRSLGGLLDGRFVVVGEQGKVAVWRGTPRVWCRLEHGGSEPTLISVVTSSMGVDAYAVGPEPAAADPLLLYIDVPDP